MFVALLLAPGVFACVAPSEGLRVDSSLDICNGVYFFKKGPVVSGNNILIDCNGAVFSGLVGYQGVTIQNSRNVTVQNCKLHGYERGFSVKNSSGVVLIDNNLVRNRVGVQFVEVTKSAVFNHDVSLRSDLELSKSEGNFLSHVNKPVSGDYCRKNLCGQPKSALPLFLSPQTSKPVMRTWLKENVAPSLKLKKWVFGDLF